MKKFAPDMFVLAALGILFVLVREFSSVPLDHVSCLETDLPHELGGWVGRDVFFCHNEMCLRELETETPDMSCPYCGQPLVKGWSLAEKRQLPPDTWLARRKYRNAEGAEVTVTLVLSGMEQVSLHRPQMCLAGQGFDMAGEKTVRFGGNGRESLDIRLLEIHRRSQMPYGSRMEWSGYYAYWFTDGRHVTPYHLVRMFYAASDRIFAGKAPRWAYVAISGSVGDEGRIPEETVGEIALLLHRYLLRAGAGCEDGR